MNVWRNHLKAASNKGVDQRQLCLDKGIVGVGWQVQFENTPVSWEEYYHKAKEDHGDSSWWTAINGIKNKMQQDDLIWTRDWFGKYYLGRVKSDWHYETSHKCSTADIVNVRDCEWYYIGAEEAVPGKVVNCFTPARTLQKIDDNTVAAFSKTLYNQNTRSSYYKVAGPGKDIFSMLSTDDCEDALAMYLQIKYGYLIVPSSSKKSSMSYEYVLKHSKTGKSAAVQVKSGHTPIDVNSYSDDSMDIFLFAVSGDYKGTPESNVYPIDSGEIRKFLYDYSYLLPDNMKVWVNLINKGM